MSIPEFVPFPKIARLNREVVVTEKIDGTNACVHVTDDGQVIAGSRSRWLLDGADNFGFAAWVKGHEDELRTGLGPGTHYGEWWGQGIQRRYGLEEKRFSLFNVHRWSDDDSVGTHDCAKACARWGVPVEFAGSTTVSRFPLRPAAPREEGSIP